MPSMPPVYPEVCTMPSMPPVYPEVCGQLCADSPPTFGRMLGMLRKLSPTFGRMLGNVARLYLGVWEIWENVARLYLRVWENYHRFITVLAPLRVNVSNGPPKECRLMWQELTER